MHSYCNPPPSRILKETRINNAMIRNCTPRCHLRTMQRMLVKLMCVVCSPIPTILFIHITKHMEAPLLTSAMCSLCRDSYIACRAHAAPKPFHCHAAPLIHTCHAAPLPCSDNAVSFVKVRVVAGNIRTASPTV